MKKPVCNECGSDEILVDAFGEWDSEGNQWVLHSTYDDLFCSSCSKSVDVTWAEVTQDEIA